MNHDAFRFALQLPILILLATIAIPAQAAEPAGHWKGAIQLPGAELEIAVTLTAEAGQELAGTIDIPAQGLKGFPLSALTVEGNHIHFEMAQVPGLPTFDGEMSESGDAIVGNFRQGPQSFQFSLQRIVKDEPGASSVADPTPPVEGLPGSGAVGEWIGSLDVGQVKLRLALSIRQAGEGALEATLDSVDQGSKVPVDGVAFEGRALSLTSTAAGASYKGWLNADGSALEGVWSQGGMELPLIFRRLQQPFVLNRPQLPVGPFPYQSHEVVFRSEAGNIRLAGTLVVPEGEGPFPAVAMVTGSGPQDRDESLLGHKPFLVIADALARRGIASLRWDDRGAEASEGDHMGSTVDDFADDTRAAVAFLRARTGIDGAAIGILGHSEGGLIAPMVAATDSSIAFLVLLAPPGEPMRSLLPRQAAAMFRLQGIDEDLIERLLAAQAADLELIADATLSAGELQGRLRALAAEHREMFTDEERGKLGIDRNSIERSIMLAATPWFRSLMRQDPGEYLRQVKVPVLALFGEKDFQVDAGVNAAAVRAALTAAENLDHEVEILPGLNHLFQHAVTGGVEEYGEIEETFAPVALERIGDWIGARFPLGRRFGAKQ
jgi:uncharacterized protein